MVEYTYEIANDIVMPNITVERKYADGVQTAYRLTANTGYVIYDTTDTTTEPMVDPETGDLVFDPETGEVIEVPVIYYCRMAVIPVKHTPETWVNIWVAVLESEVDENYISGVDNNTEVMSIENQNKKD